MANIDTQNDIAPEKKGRDKLPQTEAAVYLFPVTMTDGPAENVLSRYTLSLLKQVKFFVVENVRTARRFLKKVDRTINIDELTFVELSEHTPAEEVNSMLDPVKAGHALGVMSEAGCPAVADPGALLVDAAQRAGIKVVPLVGPSSILLALMGSGMNGQCFTFNGYLPIADGARAAALRDMASAVNRRDCTQIFIETPYRNNKLIETIVRTLPGDMRLCVASDLTGEAESVITRSLNEWKKTRFDYNKIPAIFVLGR